MRTSHYSSLSTLSYFSRFLFHCYKSLDDLYPFLSDFSSNPVQILPDLWFSIILDLNFGQTLIDFCSSLCLSSKFLIEFQSQICQKKSFISTFEIYFYLTSFFPEFYGLFPSILRSIFDSSIFRVNFVIISSCSVKREGNLRPLFLPLVNFIFGRRSIYFEDTDQVFPNFSDRERVFVSKFLDGKYYFLD